jgi:hypothetical protein
MKRILAAGVAVVLVVIGVAVVWLARSLDGLVKGAIEQVGSELLDTRVSVGGVSIDLREGSGTLRELRVRNPEGFSSADAFSLAEVTLRIELGSLGGSPIVLSEVSVAAPLVLAEATARGLNLDVLRRSVESGAASEADAQVARGEAEPLRLRIQRLQVERAQARVDATALGGEAEQIEIPALSLRDLGGRRGATPGELGKQILGEWLDRVARAVAQHQARRAVGKAIDETLRDLFD